MKILLMPNFEKKHAVECTHAVCQKLLELSVTVLMREQHRRHVDIPGVHYGKVDRWMRECDLILVIGGDGSIIHMAKIALKEQKPTLGLNAGRLGFLAGLEPTELDLLQNLITGHYTAEERMLLDVELEDAGHIRHFLALNDVVINHGMLTSMVELNVTCEGHEVISYRSDGLIFATPTGSTAYTLSAGGPIIDSSMEAIAMTPLSPHSLFDRTILFGPEKELVVTRHKGFYGEMFMIIDGEDAIALSQNMRITIRRAAQKTTLLNIDGKPFYEVLNEKFITRGLKNL